MNHLLLRRLSDLVLNMFLTLSWRKRGYFNLLSARAPKNRFWNFMAIILVVYQFYFWSGSTLEQSVFPKIAVLNWSYIFQLSFFINIYIYSWFKIFIFFSLNLRHYSMNTRLFLCNEWKKIFLLNYTCVVCVIKFRRFTVLYLRWKKTFLTITNFDSVSGRNVWFSFIHLLCYFWVNACRDCTRGFRFNLFGFMKWV